MNPVNDSRRQFTRGAALFGASSMLWSTSPALAQAWPSRPISMIAPYPAGGGVDTVARLLADQLGARLGQSITVDNKPGAGATIGALALARSAPDGKTRALAVASATRSATLPDVPTMAEAGLAGYESSTNYTVFVPAKTPADIVQKLNTEINAVMKNAAMVDKLLSLGIVVRSSSVEAARARARAVSESERWAAVIKTGNLNFN